MFESTDEQANQTASQRNGWTQALGACLGIFLISSIYTATNFYYAKRDAEIAPRQESAIGVITAKVTGKDGSIYFRFPYRDHFYPYRERLYDDSESGGSGFTVGQQVSVYFDPINPWTGSLSDFRVSSERRSQDWKLLLAASIISGSFAVFCWPRMKERQREISESATDREV
jgi:hypothetical protein